MSQQLVENRTDFVGGSLLGVAKLYVSAAPKTRDNPLAMKVASAASIALRVNRLIEASSGIPAASHTHFVPRIAFALVSSPGLPVFIRSAAEIIL